MSKLVIRGLNGFPTNECLLIILCTCLYETWPQIQSTITSIAHMIKTLKFWTNTYFHTSNLKIIMCILLHLLKTFTSCGKYIFKWCIFCMPMKNTPHGWKSMKQKIECKTSWIYQTCVSSATEWTKCYSIIYL